MGIFASVCDLCGLRSAFRRVEVSGNGHLSVVFCTVGVCGVFVVVVGFFWFVLYQFFKRCFVRPVCRKRVGALDPT